MLSRDDQHNITPNLCEIFCWIYIGQMKNDIQNPQSNLFLDVKPSFTFSNKNNVLLRFFCLLLFLFPCVTFSLTAENYTWNSVTINGGGYVPGFVFSKAEKDLLYARTDIGGAYRWDEASKKWIPLSDSVTNGNQLGVISMAADPIDANRVYMVTGLYSNSWDPFGKLFTSNDKGDTWTSTILPFKVGGNENGRGSGERLMIDPNMNSILFMGSQKEGLFTSANYGNSWEKITSFPKSQISCLNIFPVTNNPQTPSQEIYVATYDHLATNDTTVGGLYYSQDGGKNWQYLANQPTKIEPKATDDPNISTPAIVNNIEFAGENIYLTYGNNLPPSTGNGFVMKYNTSSKSWTKIYPMSHESQGGYSGLAVHPTDPNIVIVGTLGHWWPTADRIFLTKDGGSTWIDLRPKMQTDNKNTPHGGGMGWMSGLKINPFNPNHALFGSGNGLWMTYDLLNAMNDDSTHWTFENDNFEETAVITLTSPPSGAHVISGLGDIKGFTHLDLNKSPANTFHHHGNTSSIDFAENFPNTIVRSHDGGVGASISKDQGQTWQDFATQAAGGSVRDNYLSISPDAKTIVWAPNDSNASYSRDEGQTWNLCSGLAADAFPKSDRVNSANFYAINSATGDFYLSTDSAKTFNSTYTFAFTGDLSIVPVFQNEGHVWVSAQGNGLYFTEDKGTSFQKVASVQESYKVSFGKAAPNATYPTLFLFGKVENRAGLFKSIDKGNSWIKINNKSQEFGRSYLSISGDPKVYGRLYVGTHGRGIVYGDMTGADCKAPLLPSELVLCENPYSIIEPIHSFANNGYSFTWKKDGVLLNDTTSAISVSHNGTYELTVKKNGCGESSDFISVTSQLVQIENQEICYGSSIEVRPTNILDSTQRFIWTDSNTQVLDTSNLINLTPSSTSTYYVKGTTSTTEILGLASYAGGGWSLGSLFDDNQNKVKLVVKEFVKLKGISFHVLSTGTKGVIRLLDESGEIYTTSTKLNLPTGIQEIPFDIILKPGEYIIDAVGTEGAVQFQSDRTGAIWNIGETIDLVSVPGWTYGIFFNLKFEIGNSVCAAAPFEIKVNQPEPILYSYQIDSEGWTEGSSVQLCTGSKIQLAASPLEGTQWNWSGPNLFSSDSRTPTISQVSADHFGIYQTRMLDQKGCLSEAQFEIVECDGTVKNSGNENLLKFSKKSSHGFELTNLTQYSQDVFIYSAEGKMLSKYHIPASESKSIFLKQTGSYIIKTNQGSFMFYNY